MICVGRFGDRYSITGNAIGRGGEGEIFHIEGRPGCVAKIYDSSLRTEAKHRKLLVMISAKLPQNLRSQVAWPIDILYCNNAFVGFVMPIVKEMESLNVMYSSKYNLSFSDRIRIAKNLCAAVNSVHDARQVIGDFNPNNICVNHRTGMVTLIDTDSYHIRDGLNNEYRCEVGMDEYLAPEIHELYAKGYSLKSPSCITYTEKTDCFALAVHIYALLMNGAHPFSLALSAHASDKQISSGVPRVNECIRKGDTAFSNKDKGLTKPLYSPDFEMLPKDIRELFIKAFVKGHVDHKQRPSAAEWYYALGKMEGELKSCKHDKQHIYPSHLKSCPWCKLKKPRNITPMVITNHGKRKPSTRKRQIRINMNELVFCAITLLLSAGFMAAIYYIFGNGIIAKAFGSTSRQGIEYCGTNLAIELGPWGFVLCGLFGWWLYGRVSASYKKRRWHNYIVSVVVTEAAAASWVLLAYVINITVFLLALICVIAVIMFLIDAFG